MQHAFRTAEQLGITPQEHAAMIRTLHDLEDGSIPPVAFYMGERWNDCETVGCIKGWMERDMGGFFIHSCNLNLLFIPSGPAIVCRDPFKGALAIRNFLVDGDPRWPEVMTGG